MTPPARTWHDSLLATKLYAPPPRVNYIPRPRLTGRLDRALALGHKFISIAAPAGFGKTTVVSDWLYPRTEQAETVPSPRRAIPEATRRFSWLTLDESDNDLTRFLTYLLAALEPLAPETRDWDALGQRVSTYPPPPPETILVPVLNDLGSTGNDSTPRLLILDDYHAIHNTAIHNAISFFIEHLPPHVHLIVTARVDPPFPLARWRARGEITELRAGDLSFASEEAASFLNHTMQLNLSPAQVTALESRTEGWIAGLQLAGIALTSTSPGDTARDDRARFITAFAGTHRVVSDYLMEEVLQRQTPLVQQFLLQTSILDRFCAPLCDVVPMAETAGSGRSVLDELEKSHLFLIPLDDTREWYRYHHLWMDALRYRLQQTQAAHVRDLHQRASAWFEDNGFVGEAVEHAILARDWERGARLVEDNTLQMIDRAEFGTLREWFARFPDTLFDERPRLCVSRAWWLLTTGERDKIDGVVTCAEQTLEHAGWSAHDADALRGEIAVIKSALLLERGDFPGALEQSARARMLLARGNKFLRGLPETYGALAKFWRGQVRGVEHELAQATEYGIAAGNLNTVFTAACSRGEVLLMQGRVPEALTQLLELEAQTRELHIERRPYVALLYVNLGMVYYELNELDRCRAAFEHAMELSEFGGMPRPREWLIAVAFLAWIHYLSGDRAGALEWVARGQEHLKHFQIPAWAKSHLLDSAQCVGVWDHDLDETRRWLERNEIYLGQDTDYVNELPQMALVRVKTLHGDLTTALAQLQRMTRSAEQEQRSGSLIRLYALTAVLYEQMGEHALAIERLERALDLGQPHGLVRAIIDEGETVEALLLEMSRDPARSDPPQRRSYIQRLRVEAERDRLATSAAPVVPTENTQSADSTRSVSSAGTGKAATVPPMPGAGWYEALSARELEILRLVAQGYSNREIAGQLVVSIGTIKTHLNNIFRKLDATSRVHAIRQARDFGLLD